MTDETKLSMERLRELARWLNNPTVPRGIDHYDAQRLLAYIEELEARRAARRFPVLDLGCSVPWAIVEAFERRAQMNHGGQTLERLAERGGLSPVELWCVAHGVGWENRCNREQAEAWVHGILAVERHAALAPGKEMEPPRPRSPSRHPEELEKLTVEWFTWAARTGGTMRERDAAVVLNALVAERDALRAQLAEVVGAVNRG